MLCPTLTQSTKDSGKYVLIMLSTANLERFVQQMVCCFAIYSSSMHVCLRVFHLHPNTRLTFFLVLVAFLCSYCLFLQKAVPFVSKKKNLNDWLSHRSDWLSWESKDFLFAHINRIDHSIEELRERALLEQDIKSKIQRRKNRSSLRNGGNGDVAAAAADPGDCLTYAMYPIEPEVLVCDAFVF